MKLLCDHMLGSLAKWLRIFGFDTIYPDATMDDDYVLEVAHREKRVLISRDKELLRRARKAQIPTVDIQTTDLSKQLQQVLKLFPVDQTCILSRCTLCNTLLQPINKAGLQKKIPEKVFMTRNDFWMCPTCSKYYWMGTHYENMMEKINILLRKDTL